VLFWARKDRPSFTMRGRQVGARLEARGYEVDYRTGWEPWALRGVRDSIVVAVKARPHLVNLVRHGNRVIWDAIDYEPSSYAGQVHAAIAGTEDMRARLESQLGSAIPVTTIYHHADPFLEPHRAGEETLRLVYVGEPRNSAFLRGQIPRLEKVSFRKAGWRDALRDFNAHFSARNDRSKAVVKLSNVAALGAVFLTGREPGCVELLGEDYPFYIPAPKDLDAVKRDVARLEAAVGGPEWREARARIDALRDRLSIEASADAYAKLIDSM
jgi:hypothetical protein